MAIVLALMSAWCYGVSDYIGGRASRRSSALTVTFAAEVTIFPVTLVVLPLVEDGPFTAAALWWGAAGGVAGSAGVLGLYTALSRGAMTVVAPVTGVVAAVLPVVVGLATGERPSVAALLGIAIALVAVALVGGMVGALHQPVTVATVVLAVVVGALFGTLFVAFAQTGDDAGLWPLLAARLGSVPLLSVAYAVARRRGRVDRLGSSTWRTGAVIGTLILLANGLYLVSTREGLLSIVAVLVSLYPASTVLLATVVDHERSTRPQILGMVLAAVAVALVTAG
jgi:drug/metabolite transporter (DMT)-like permease